VISNLGN